jgi:bifunctional enzyme CysN/CysC
MTTGPLPVPQVAWLTGLSGAGKSTIAGDAARRLTAGSVGAFVLDGDVLRRGLSADLGFSAADRRENVRRVAEVACLMADAGLVVLVALISPLAADRALAREIIGTHRFSEVFVDVPLAVAERRDPKGLYRKARSGELPNFTGLTAPYEPPEDPDLHLETAACSAAEAVDLLLSHLSARTAVRA